MKLMMGSVAAAVAALVVSVSAQGQNAPAAPPPAWNEVPLVEHAFQPQTAPFRRDTFDVTVAPGPGLEVNLAMKRGASVVYSWRVSSPADAVVLSEFHGHTVRVPPQPGTLMFYKKATGSNESGSLVAPFDGIHAWYFRNDTKTPVVIRLTTAGFYEVDSKSPAIVAVP